MEKFYAPTPEYVLKGTYTVQYSDPVHREDTESFKIFSAR